MIVLSCFDGISSGRIALERAGIPVELYLASEIDKWAIQVTQANYPGTVQLGDVCGVHAKDLPKIDMVIGGTPCTGFSFAGKQLNFNDPRSALIFEYFRLLKEIKPKYFLLENVIMKEEYKNAISEILGSIYPECVQQKGLFSEGRLEPAQINSSLVSAQNRDRLYWHNFPVVGLPADRGIMLKDIIESGLTKKDKSYCIDANYAKGGNLKSYIEHGRRQLIQKDNLCIMVGEADGINGHGYNKRIYSEDGKAPTLNAGGGGNLEPKVALENLQWRKLTPAECEKLQTLPTGYTKEGAILYSEELAKKHEKDILKGMARLNMDRNQIITKMSNSQRYRQCGNGWTVDVIAWLFSFIDKAR